MEAAAARTTAPAPARDGGGRKPFLSLSYTSNSSGLQHTSKAPACPPIGDVPRTSGRGHRPVGGASPSGKMRKSLFNPLLLLLGSALASRRQAERRLPGCSLSSVACLRKGLGPAPDSGLGGEKPWATGDPVPSSLLSPDLQIFSPYTTHTFVSTLRRGAPKHSLLARF